ncbi:MAG: HEAT repeat domain-containing protein, partial [Planctomycetales bacterium]
AALENFGPHAALAVPGLVHMMFNDEDEYDRREAAETIGNLGPAAKDAAPDLLKAFQEDEESYVRNAALQALLKVAPGDENALLSLMPLLKDDDARETIVEELQGMGAQAVVILAKASQDDDVELRRNAIKLLGSREFAGRARASLLQAVGDEDQGVRVAAVSALSSLQAGKDMRPAIPVLIEALRDAEDNLYELNSTLQEMGRASVAPLAEVIAEADNSTEFRARAIKILSHYSFREDRSAKSALLKALTDKEPRIRARAAIALSQGKHDKKDNASILEALQESLQAESAELRREGAYALQRQGADAKAAVPALMKLLVDEDRNARNAAAYALSRVGVQGENLQSVIDLLENDVARVGAVTVLGSLKTSADLAVPPLVKVLHFDDQDEDDDSDENARRRAARALAQIGKPSLEPLLALLADDKAAEPARVA